MMVVYMHEKRSLTDIQLDKILNTYGEYSNLPLYDASGEFPINKKDDTWHLHIEVTDDNKSILVSVLDKNKMPYRSDYWKFKSNNSDVYFAYTLKGDNSKDYAFKCLPDNEKVYRHPTNTQQLKQKIAELTRQNKEKDIKIEQLQELLASYQQQADFIPATDTSSDQTQDEAIAAIAKNIQQDRKIRKQTRKPPGRHKKLSEKDIQIVQDLYMQGYSMREISLQMHCCKSTIFNTLKKLRF